MHADPVQLCEYSDEKGRSPFARWFNSLSAAAAAKVATALYRVGQGNFSNVKGVGAGVYELKVDFGPGYRVYFGKQGERVAILLGGSSKKRQRATISAAQTAWAEQRQAVKEGGGQWH